MANPNPAQQLHLQTDTLGDNLLSEWMQPHYYPWQQSVRALASVNRALAAASVGLIDDMKNRAKKAIRVILGYPMMMEAKIRRLLLRSPGFLIARDNAFGFDDRLHTNRQIYWNAKERLNYRVRDLYGPENNPYYSSHGIPLVRPTKAYVRQRAWDDWLARKQ